MLLKLFLLFVTVPLVELSLLLILGDLTEWYVPVLVVILSGALGAILARRQGFQTFRRMQRELEAGQLPADSLLDAVLICVAGALLLTPGLLTDALGLSLLIGPGRRFYKSRLIVWIEKRWAPDRLQTDAQTSPHSEVVDSYVDRPEQRDETGG